jgi:hypothetical protein
VETYRAAVKRWPGAKITLRNGRGSSSRVGRISRRLQCVPLKGGGIIIKSTTEGGVKLVGRLIFWRRAPSALLYWRREVDCDAGATWEAFARVGGDVTVFFFVGHRVTSSACNS